MRERRGAGAAAREGEPDDGVVDLGGLRPAALVRDRGEPGVDRQVERVGGAGRNRERGGGREEEVTEQHDAARREPGDRAITWPSGPAVKGAPATPAAKPLPGLFRAAPGIPLGNSPSSLCRGRLSGLSPWPKAAKEAAFLEDRSRRVGPGPPQRVTRESFDALSPVPSPRSPRAPEPTGEPAFSKRVFPMREIKLQDLKSKTADRTPRLRRRARGRERLDHAQAGADVRDPEAARRPGGRDHRRGRRRGAAGRLRLPALGRLELPAGSGRHLRLALADPPLRPAHRRHGRGPDPRPEGGRALFRAAQGQHDQFRGSGEDPAQGPFRQPDAALSRRAPQARDRGPDQEGLLGPRHRHRRADRQGPARPDRRAAAHRQDGAAAEHRAVDHRQPPGMLPHRAAHRRAAGGSHRHAALGEGRGRLLDLRRAGHRATSRSPRW